MSTRTSSGFEDADTEDEAGVVVVAVDVGAETAGADAAAVSVSPMVALLVAVVTLLETFFSALLSRASKRRSKSRTRSSALAFFVAEGTAFAADDADAAVAVGLASCSVAGAGLARSIIMVE